MGRRYYTCRTRREYGRVSAGVDGEWSRPSAPIRALTSGYASPHREEKPLAFLQALIDDSASEIADRRLFMAGYVNRAEIWSSFADAWAEELNAKPSIEYLKMVEATNLRGQFKGWQEDARDEKLRKLARKICCFDSLSFDFSISRKAYYQDVRPVAPRGLGNPYFPCALSVISGIARFINDQKISLPIDMIFDEQLGVSDDIDFFFEYVREHLPKGARSLINARPIFRDDKLFLPLQAADMLVWRIRREHETGGPGATLAMADELRNSDGHLTCRIEDDIVRTWSREFAKEMAGIPPLQSKSQWRNAKRGMARALARGFVPPYRSRWKNALYGARKRLARLFRS